MKKILFTSTLASAPWAGSEILWSNTAKALTHRGYEVGVLLPVNMRSQENVTRLAQNNIKVLTSMLDSIRFFRTRINRRFSPESPGFESALISHAKSFKADIVCISQASCWGAYREMIALKEMKIPYVSISQLNNPFNWPGDKLLAPIGEAFCSAKAAVFVSHGNLDLLQNQIARKLNNALVLYNPPSFKPVFTSLPEKEKGVLRLLSVARIDPAHKGQDLLFNVLAMEKWRKRNVFLKIAGGGDLIWAKQLISKLQLSNVEILDHQDDLRALWSWAHYGIFCSRYEGMPLALIEGMGMARPILATDIAGHSEWVEHGKNGFIAAAPTLELIDDALEEAWSNKTRLRELALSARETYEKKNPLESSIKLAELLSI